MKGVIKLSLLALSISFSFVGYAESKSVEVLSAVVKDQKYQERRLLFSETANNPFRL